MRNALEDSFGEMKNGLKVVINLVYFNSSSARVLMEILDQLDEQASAEFPVNVDWYCDPDDDITREFAEDISEDLNAVSFTIMIHPAIKWPRPIRNWLHRWRRQKSSVMRSTPMSRYTWCFQI